MTTDRFHFQPRTRGTRLTWAVAVVVLWCGGLALAGDAQAQTAPVGSDPSITITRTVNPRIAYRGVPKEDLPVAAQATTFPQKAFQAQLGHITALGDDVLSTTQAGGAGMPSVLNSTLVAPTSTFAQTLGAQGSGGGAVPRGLGATVGGAVGSATSGIGNTVTGAVNGALGRVGGGL